MTEYWYRYYDRRYAPPVDEFDNPIGPGRVEVRLEKFLVLKHTKRGVWIGYHPEGWKRFVRLEGRKRFACPTQQEALESFVARKMRQISIHKAWVRDAEEALRIVRREHLEPTEVFGVVLAP